MSPLYCTFCIACPSVVVIVRRYLITTFFCWLLLVVFFAYFYTFFYFNGFLKIFRLILLVCHSEGKLLLAKKCFNLFFAMSRILGKLSCFFSSLYPYSVALRALVSLYCTFSQKRRFSRGEKNLTL